MASFNPLTATASHISSLLNEGSLTSERLIHIYLSQIEAHNHAGLHLNALISVAPVDCLIESARELDRERREGKVRGLLHGIPVVVKVGVFVRCNPGGYCGVKWDGSSRGRALGNVRL